MKIASVSIVGLGAVGAVVASRLTSFLGKAKVQCIVDPARKARYESDGIFINGVKQDFNYVVPEDAVPSDLIIIVTKNLQLGEVLKSIRSAVGVHTAIMVLCTGIQSERDAASVYGKERVLYSFIIGISSIHEKNQIRCPAEGRIVFGEKDNKKTDRVKAVEELFAKAEIESEIPENIHLEQWKKFLLNVVFNTLSALCRAPYGAFSAPVMRDLARSVGREVIAVAQAEGVPLTQTMFEDTLSLIIGLDADGKTSMLQDFEAGRKSENAWFCGTVNKLGKVHGIPTPVCTLLEALVEGTETARNI